MKKQFSPNWKSSVQRRKQRKYRANAPMHIRQKMISSHLSKNLRSEYKTRSVQVRTGDEVVVATGEFRKKGGKVTEVDKKSYRIFVEGITKKKANGQETNLSIDPSNVVITKLNVEDKARVKSLRRGK